MYKYWHKLQSLRIKLVNNVDKNKNFKKILKIQLRKLISSLKVKRKEKIKSQKLINNYQKYNKNLKKV